MDGSSIALRSVDFQALKGVQWKENSAISSVQDFESLLGTKFQQDVL